MAQQQVEVLILELYSSWNNGHTNFVFKLHYLVSFQLMSIFIIATSVQLYEKNYVNCVGTKGETEEHIDKFAYYFSNFTMIKDIYGGIKNGLVIHNYYFWVPVMFIYQLFVFRWTYYVWQRHSGRLLLKLEEDKCKTKIFVGYIAQRFEHKLNDTWLFQLMFLELQNILVCAHMWITINFVLNGKFYQLGLDLSFENLNELFPYKTKFYFTTYGSSGDIQNNDYMCILGLNALYKYIFSFYWWWLVILTTLTVLNFIIRIALMMCRRKIWFWEQHLDVWLQTNQSWFISLRYSDWVFIKYLHAGVSLGKYRAVLRYLTNPKMRRHVGEDTSSESSDNNGNELDREDQEEQRNRYRELLRTIMHPVPMLTKINNDDHDRPGAERFFSKDHPSGPTTTKSPRILDLVPNQTCAVGHKEKAEAVPVLQNFPDLVNRDWFFKVRRRKRRSPIELQEKKCPI